ncbi:MAG: hypothetical protein WC736_09930 [Gallionella sp.]|jgi:hypothetical protein
MYELDSIIFSGFNMIQNNKGATVAHQFQRTSSRVLGAMLLSLPLFISPPSLAANDVSVDPAIILPSDPVWPAPPIPDVSIPAPDILIMTPTQDPLAASDVPVAPVMSAQAGVPVTLP